MVLQSSQTIHPIFKYLLVLLDQCVGNICLHSAKGGKNWGGPSPSLPPTTHTHTHTHTLLCYVAWQPHTHTPMLCCMATSIAFPSDSWVWSMFITELHLELCIHCTLPIELASLVSALPQSQQLSLNYSNSANELPNDTGSVR